VPQIIFNVNFIEPVVEPRIWVTVLDLLRATEFRPAAQPPPKHPIARIISPHRGKSQAFFCSDLPLAAAADSRYNKPDVSNRFCERADYMGEYVEVFVASDITFAYLMKANLENEGITVRIDNENLQGAYCLDGMVPRVLVPAEQAEKARRIIKEIQQASQNEPQDDEQ
jgi:hypothetical protein